MKLEALFKALSDETRLRLMGLLSRHELNVNEIVQVMEMGQPRVSRHLRLLADCGLLSSRRDGLWVFYQANRADIYSEIIDWLSRLMLEDEVLRGDIDQLEKRLQDSLQERTSFFDSLAPRWDVVKEDIIGKNHLIGEILGYVPSCTVAADLGCGTGELLPSLRQKAEHVIGVDKSPKMLEEARRRFSQDGNGIELRIGEMEHLPMRDGEADMAVINMVLHHLISPEIALKETARALKPGSTLIIIDLNKHEEERLRTRFGHRWLGFERTEIETWLNQSGFAEKAFYQREAGEGLSINLFVSQKGRL